MYCFTFFKNNFFASHNNLFEEIAKFRAARRIWAKLMKDRFHARKKRSMWMRMHVQTAGSTLTAQQPQINIVRVALQALAAVLGGTQSLHTNSFDEALALPSEEASTLALRTQQIIAHETGVPDIIDPLGGSFHVEQLTNEIEAEAWELIKALEEVGGMPEAIRQGIPQKAIHATAYQTQKMIDAVEKPIVAQNIFPEPIDSGSTCSLHHPDMQAEADQKSKLRELRARRDSGAVKDALLAIEAVARTDQNLFPAVLDAVRARATLGEIVLSLASVFGRHVPVEVF